MATPPRAWHPVWQPTLDILRKRLTRTPSSSPRRALLDGAIAAMEDETRPIQPEELAAAMLEVSAHAQAMEMAARRGSGKSAPKLAPKPPPPPIAARRQQTAPADDWVSRAKAPSTTGDATVDAALDMLRGVGLFAKGVQGLDNALQRPRSDATGRRRPG